MTPSRNNSAKKIIKVIKKKRKNTTLYEPSEYAGSQINFVNSGGGSGSGNFV